MHAIAAGIMGYYLAHTRFEGKWMAGIFGYGLAVLTHGAFDVFIFALPVAWQKGHTVLMVLGYIGPVLIVIFSALFLKKLITKALELDDLNDRIHTS